MADGSIVIDTRIDSDGAEKGVKGLSTKLGSVAKGSLTAFVKGAAAASVALSGVGIASIKLASDLGEVQNVVDTTFGKNASKINDWSKSAALAFGLSELQAKQFNGTLGAMLKSMGLTDTQVLKMSESMVGLSGDFASFYNLDSKEAFDKIRAGISGETEPLKQLGINMSVANLEAYALAEGIKKPYKEMTQSEQALLRYNYLMSVSKDAQGDFAKTSDSLANQLRIAKLSIQDLGSSIGSALLPMATSAIKELNGMVGRLKTAFDKGGFDGLATALGEVVAKLITDISNQAPKFIDMGIKILQSLIAGIQNNLPQIAASAVDIIKSLVLGFLTSLPQLLNLGLQLIIQLVTGIAKALPQLLSTGSNTITSFINSLMVAIPQLITAAIGIIQTLATGIIGALPQMIPAIISIVTGICDMIIANIGTIVDIGIQVLLALVQGIVNSLPMLIEKVPQIINQFSNAIYAQFPKILKAGIDILLMLIKGLIAAIPTLIANIPQIIMAIINVITLYNWASLGKSVIAKLGEGITSMKASIGATAKSIAQGVGDAISGIFKGGLSWGKNLISSIGGGFSSMGSFLGSSARSVATAALNGIKSIFTGGFNIGENLIQGIWNGIGNMKQWILNKIGGFAGSIISGIKEKFGIHSPSTIMRDLIGVNLVKGIGVGVDLETPNLQKDINANISDLTAKLQTTVDYETASTTAKVVARNNSISGIETYNNTSKDSAIPVIVHAHLDVDGKEFTQTVVAPNQDVLTEYYEGR